MEVTKKQREAERRYREQLKRCGYRGWSHANAVRCLLIDRDVYQKNLDATDQKHLKALERLTELYLKWKTNDDLGRGIRRLVRLRKKLEAKYVQ